MFGARTSEGLIIRPARRPVAPAAVRHRRHLACALLASGPVPPNPLEVLGSDRLDQLLAAGALAGRFRPDRHGAGRRPGGCRGGRAARRRRAAGGQVGPHAARSGAARAKRSTGRASTRISWGSCHRTLPATSAVCLGTELTMKGVILAGGTGTPLAPADAHHQQAPAAGLRQADDLLPDRDAGLGWHRRGHGGHRRQPRRRIPAAARATAASSGLGVCSSRYQAQRGRHRRGARAVRVVRRRRQGGGDARRQHPRREHRAVRRELPRAPGAAAPDPAQGDGGSRAPAHTWACRSSARTIDSPSFARSPRRRPARTRSSASTCTTPDVFDDRARRCNRRAAASSRSPTSTTRTSIAGQMEYDVIHGFWGDAGESIDVYYQVIDYVRSYGANQPAATARGRARWPSDRCASWSPALLASSARTLSATALSGHPADEVVGFDLLTYAGHPREPRAADDVLSFVHGDIGDSDVASSALREHAIDTVVNFAAEIAQQSAQFWIPDEFFRTNVLGTRALLESARQAGLRALPQVRRARCTATVPWTATRSFSEDSPVSGQNALHASKAGGDHAVRAYHETFGRAGHDHQLREQLRSVPVPRKGDPALHHQRPGRSCRCPLYARRQQPPRVAARRRPLPRPSRLVLRGAGRARPTTSARGVERSVEQIADTDPRRSSASLQSAEEFVPDRPGHDRRYLLDSSKLRRETGWSPSDLVRRWPAADGRVVSSQPWRGGSRSRSPRPCKRQPGPPARANTHRVPG